MAPLSQHTASVCTACGLTCDDITLHVDDNKIVDAERACEVGRAHFLQPSPNGEIAIDGDATSLDSACGHIAELLIASQFPLVSGLAPVSTEAQRAALALADRAGGVASWSNSPDDFSSTESMQTVGQVATTWGEVAQRADIVIFWASDPQATHPRLFERYFTDTTSRWLPAGRSDRFMICIDDEPNSTGEVCDQQIDTAKNGHYVSASVLRALVRQVQLDASELSQSTGIELTVWQDLAKKMQTARYGVIVTGKRLAANGPQNYNAITQLVAAMTRHTRWSTIGEGGAGNATGAGNAFAWQTGLATDVDFSQDIPRPATIRNPRKGNCPYDVCLKFDLTSLQVESNGVTVVQIPIARSGIETNGNTYRADGVALPQRACIDSSLPAAEAVLKKITDRLPPLGP